MPPSSSLELLDHRLTVLDHPEHGTVVKLQAEVRSIRLFHAKALGAIAVVGFLATVAGQVVARLVAP